MTTNWADEDTFSIVKITGESIDLPLAHLIPHDSTSRVINIKKITTLLDRYRNRINEIFQATEPTNQSRFEPDVLEEVISDLEEIFGLEKTMKEKQIINDILELINAQKEKENGGVRQLYIHNTLLHNADTAYIVRSLERLGYKCFVDEDNNDNFLEVWW